MLYLFAASHVNHAQYGLHYMKMIEKLPTVVLHPFLRGEHSVRHQEVT